MPEVTQLDRIERAVTRLAQRVDLLLSLARAQLAEQADMAVSLDDITQHVTEIESVDQSAIELLKKLADKVGSLEPTQEAIDALAARIRTSAEALAAAVTANTPAAG